jgi:hypothetical protein
MGVPWRLAFALQQPFYAGKIKKESDRIWLAAMIDGEGCMFIHKRKAGQPNGQGYFRKNDVYGAGLEVANTHESIIKRCMEITGEQGSICRVERETKNRFRNIPLYRWNMRSNQCREIIAEIYPYLVGKQHEARILLGCPPSGPDAEKAHASLIALHNGKDACIDFPPPKSFYEPGWYLRSDIIWAKKNPMPESVTDRCTKAHEYIFLLTKSAKYFYDAEAVKEDGVIAAGTKGAKGSKERFEMDGVNSRPPEYKVYSGTRNLRSVWTIATESFPDAHFATFPRKLVEPCILAGTSEKGCCPECGSPWVREIKRTPATSKPCPKEQASHEARGGTGNHTGTVGKSGSGRIDGFTETLGWSPTCSCNMAYPDYEAARDDPAYVPYNPVPCTILDPFAGSGTTGLVAYEHGREFIGIELSPDYCRMAEKRIAKATAQGKLF